MIEMQPRSDAQLLRDYSELGKESAFAEIVTRHTDLVYSAALRQVYSPDLARDVTQSVFTDLARKARSLSAGLNAEASLVGWLYRATRFAARDLYRNETRRTQRERLAMEQLQPESESTPDWNQLSASLDDAMSDLDEFDREAILLRYFKNNDLRTVGAVLGISDDAAQKRVSRALERLREIFAKRGVTVGASGLAVVISANAVQAAPAGLALAISTAATLTGTTLATTTVTATKAIAMTALQKTIVTATIAVLAGAGIYESRKASQLRRQVQTLEHQQAPLAEQIQQLKIERNAARDHAAASVQLNGINKNSNAELLKLRGEVGLLRRQNQTLTQALATQQKAGEIQSPDNGFGTLGKFLSSENTGDAGNNTAEDLLRTFIWAIRENRIDRLEQLGAPLPSPDAAIDETGTSYLEMFKIIQKVFTNSAGFRLSSKANADNPEYEVRLDAVPLQANEFMKGFHISVFLKQTTDGWIFVAPPQ